MSEIKRVAFTTISSSTSASGTSGGVGGGGTSSGNAGTAISTATSAAALHRFGVPDPVTSHKSSSIVGSGGSGGGGSKPGKTIRLNMELFASNSNSFPEFNYSKLIHLEKKKIKKLKSKQNGFSDPFEENDDDVARIAKELEKKYGTTYASGRGRSKKDDFCDIGLGYDESDSFIDNTEAYDEIIPEEVETVEGGFYINSGALVFKHLSSTEKTDEIIKMPNKTRKRALSSSSEESGSSEEEAEDNETDTTPTVASAASGANSKVSSSSSSKQKSALPTEKRHKTSSDKEGSDKEKSSKSKSSTTSTSTASSVTVSASASPKDDDVGSEPGSKDKARIERTIKTTTVKDMLKAKRDSFLKMQEEEQKTKTSNGEVKPSSNSANEASGSDSSSDESDSNDGPSAKKLKKTTEDDSDKLRQSDSKLPELSDELYRDIQDMKDTAKSSNRTGKKFQFDEKLTELFLRIDEASMCMDKNVRNVVYAHLEYQLSLPKYFLLRKAKQLRINQEKSKTKKAFVKLRKAVADHMANITQQYQLNLRIYEEFQSVNAGVDAHKLDNVPKMPKKRFTWNDAIRTLLYDLYQVRWMSYTVLRTRKESFEDFVGNFLKEKVVNIWPSGWMKYEELKREIEKKKNVPKKLKENKKPDESPDALTTIDNVNMFNQDGITNSGGKLPLNPTELYATASCSELKPNEVAKLLPAHSNAAVDHLHPSKTYSSSGKVHRSSTNSPLNLCSAQSQSSAKGEKSSSGSVINNNNNANPNQNINSNRSTSSVNISKNVVDLVSPSKRTDHSINSIMSSPSSTSSSVSTTPQPQHSAGMSTNTLNMENNTHVINIDNFRSATDIINTMNHTNKPQSTERLKNRSSASAAAADIHSHTHPQFKMESSRCDSSSESDGVEIVGVYQARTNPTSLQPKLKYKKASHQNSRGDSPGQNDKLKTAPATAASKKSVDNSDLDVKKIMKALKELEELQQTGNYVPDISSLTSSNHNANTSPLAYGKDLTQ